jgi:hypothetical protein
VARWDSEDSYPPIEVRLGRAWRSGWRWFVGLSVYSLLALAIVAAIDDPSFALGVPGVLWITFLTCVPARLLVAALKPLARRIPGAILLAFLVGVPLGIGIILVFQHYDPQSSLGGPFSIAKRFIVWSPMWAAVTGVMIWAYPKSWFTWSYFR